MTAESGRRHFCTGGTFQPRCICMLTRYVIWIRIYIYIYMYIHIHWHMHNHAHSIYKHTRNMHVIQSLQYTQTNLQILILLFKGSLHVNILPSWTIRLLQLQRSQVSSDIQWHPVTHGITRLDPGIYIGKIRRHTSQLVSFSWYKCVRSTALLVGGWLEKPLWKIYMTSSVLMMIKIWKNKNHVPNHQPDKVKNHA